MSKVRVHELAKRYGMKGPEMAEVLRSLGFDNVKSHMAVLDEADQMMVLARLEAQGMQIASDVVEDGTATASAPVKRALPARKTLPAARELPRKKGLPGSALAEAAGNEASEPAVMEPSVAEPVAPQNLITELPATTPTREAATSSTSTSSIGGSAATPETRGPDTRIPEPPEAKAPATEIPAAKIPTAETHSRDIAAPETDSPEQERVAAPPTREPAVEAQRVAEAAASSTAPAVRPEVESRDTPPAAGDGQAPVKRLLMPQAKATVVRRIELPEATIRDATRRSAPGGQRNPSGVDGGLRRAALQHTQSRTAQRGAPGQQRRGPSTGGRGGRGVGRGKGKQKTGLSLSTTIDPDKEIQIEPPISVKGLSEALGVKVSELIAVMTFKLGIKGKTINSFLTDEDVAMIGLGLERNIKLVENKEAEEELDEYVRQHSENMERLHRAPVVTFMGHVDHGKTSLLDALRRADTSLTAGEAGGITQHIGAFRVTTEKGISFVVLDTPGHAAFTSMRARGANITDVVVLVVAADDGVMPQTEEALSHALEAKAPIVVAVNKCDLHGANPDQVRQQLAVKGVQPEEWGGNTAFINVSAKTGQGLDDLAERIILESEIAELGARPEAPGSGVVIESRQSAEQGIVVNVLVMDGTLRVRDMVVCGESYARVRGLTNDHGKQVDEAGPATPVSILGIDRLPQPGDKFSVVKDKQVAQTVIEDRQRRARDLNLAERTAVTMENLSATLAAQNIDERKLIIRADVMGSLEPIKSSLAQLATDEVRFNIIHSGLGAITETDVGLAAASGAVVIGFNTVADGPARVAAERSGVQIRYYDIIYKMIDEMKLVLEGMLRPEELEKIQGHAEVRALFRSSKFGTIAGCYILDGFANRNSRVRLSRNGKVVHKGSLGSLRRIDDDVREVKTGFECGMTLANFNDIKQGDQLEFYDIEFVKRTLD